MENKKILNILIKKLEKNIDEYCGNYGSLEHRLEETLHQILDILAFMNGETHFEDWYLEKIKKDDE